MSDLNTRLMNAARGGHAEIVQELIDGGADVHADDDAAVRAAARGGHAEVLRALLGADHVYDAGADSRGYRFYRVKMRDGMHVIAGCRNFGAAQARAHWPEGTECRALAEKCIKAGDGT